ncbi:hypothetical protein [uncultured Tateyamaria sp.]|uniref:hypothetical protein n=1 Tax=uncultured Tateyamaria sp. TaxID=455651 RepID=UPI002606A145|nr:hypothetical protein [uncultured Tateyamaria sp.]
MSSTNQSSRLVVSPASAPDASDESVAEMTEKTAAELRALCEAKGEPFDTALSETQAQQRIEALKAMD